MAYLSIGCIRHFRTFFVLKFLKNELSKIHTSTDEIFEEGFALFALFNRYIMKRVRGRSPKITLDISKTLFLKVAYNII